MPLWRREVTPAEIKAYRRTGRGSARVAEAAAKPGAGESPFKQAKKAAAAARKRGRR